MITVIAPYAMLTILLVRTLFLEDSWKGIQYLLNFEGSKILSPTTWYRVMDQLFFQHGLGFGYVFCFATFRSYSEKIWKSAVMSAH
jgi:SNF family Na+-dependent transporter